MEEIRRPDSERVVQALIEVDRRLSFEPEPVARWVGVRPGPRILALLILVWKRHRRGEWLRPFPWIPIAVTCVVGAILGAIAVALALVLRTLATPVGG